VQKRLPGADETFWNAVRPNLTRFDEAKDWWHIACESVAGAVTEAAFVAEAAGLLPPEPWGPGTWDEWVSVLKNRTGRKGKELFMPLRLALTGREHGPELKVLLPLIGRSRATERMNGRAA
jgi:glutamyl-tRNA synthetase